MKKKSILVFRSAALGDFILATPAFSKIREHFPGFRIILLTITSASSSLTKDASLYTNGIISSPWTALAIPHLIDEVFHIKSLTNILYLYKLRRSLKSYNFEKVILLLDPCAPWFGRLKKILLIFFLIGLKPVVGWRGRGSLNGDKAALKRKGLLRHHVHGAMQFLSELNPPIDYCDDDILFDLRPDVVSVNWAKNWLSSHNLSFKRIVAVVPGSIRPHKKWPIEKFNTLVHLLINQHKDIFIIVLGIPDDWQTGENLRAISKSRIFNLAGKTSIPESAALLQDCVLLVGNDGGSTHLANSMGCKVVSIISGIEYPDSIEPWNNRDLCIRADISCSPCYSFMNCPLGTNKCINDIEVDQVIEKCNIVLENQLIKK